MLNQCFVDLLVEGVGEGKTVCLKQGQKQLIVDAAGALLQPNVSPKG